jgi:hypothetical protein
MLYSQQPITEGNDNYSDIQELEDNESKLDNKNDIELIMEF